MLQRIKQVRVLFMCGYMGNGEFCRAEKELAQLLEQGQRRVILDLGTPHEFQRRGGELKLAGMPASLRRMAELAGFNQERGFDTDVAMALTSMSETPGHRRGEKGCQ